MTQTVERTVPYDVWQREHQQRVEAEKQLAACQEVREAQKRSLNALQTENRWFQNVIFNTSFNDRDMRLLVYNTPREMRMGLCTAFPEKMIYMPDQAVMANCSEKVASQRLRALSEQGAFRYHTVRNDETGNTRSVLQPLPPAEAPLELMLTRGQVGGSTWKDGKRVRRCKDCGSDQLARVSQIICMECGAAQAEKTYTPINTPQPDGLPPDDDPGCHNDTDPDCHNDTDPDCHNDTDPPTTEITDQQQQPLEDHADPGCHNDTDPQGAQIPNLPPITVDTEGSIEELKRLPVWVCHREKEPFNVSKEYRIWPMAKCDDPRTWTTYERARSVLERSHAEGWKRPFDGLMFANNGDYAFIDGDHCLNPATGEISEIGRALLAVGSYVETSYGGDGFHCITRANDLPGERRRVQGLEIYLERRFFTYTGRHRAETPTTIEARQEQVHALYRAYFPADKERPAIPPAPNEQEPGEQEQQPPICIRPHAEILERARNASNGSGEKFARLYDHGDWGSFRYPSQSEADVALFEILLYWTDGDVSTSDALFRLSGLYREKWERDDYRERTINGAYDYWQRSQRKQERRAS